eukprot:112940-Amphidinium_carterae.1
MPLLVFWTEVQQTVSNLCEDVSEALDFGCQTCSSCLGAPLPPTVWSYVRMRLARLSIAWS